MKRLALVVILLSGCSVGVPTEVERTPIEQTLEQHTIMLDALIEYIASGQRLGSLPTPEDLRKE